MKINSRDLEVLKILYKASCPLTSTQIVNAGEGGLTQSTVQAVLRKLLATEMVEVPGITHSGNVLSRTFSPTEKSKEVLKQKFVDEISAFSNIIDINDVVAAMFKEEDNLDIKKQKLEDLEDLVAELKKSLE